MAEAIAGARPGVIVAMRSAEARAARRGRRGAGRDARAVPPRARAGRRGLACVPAGRSSTSPRRGSRPRAPRPSRWSRCRVARSSTRMPRSGSAPCSAYLGRTRRGAGRARARARARSRSADHAGRVLARHRRSGRCRARATGRPTQRVAVATEPAGRVDPRSTARRSAARRLESSSRAASTSSSRACRVHRPRAQAVAVDDGHRDVALELGPTATATRLAAVRRPASPTPPTQELVEPTLRYADLDDIVLVATTERRGGPTLLVQRCAGFPAVQRGRRDRLQRSSGLAAAARDGWEAVRDGRAALSAERVRRRARTGAAAATLHGLPHPVAVGRRRRRRGGRDRRRDRGRVGRRGRRRWSA